MVLRVNAILGLIFEPINGPTGVSCRLLSIYHQNSRRDAHSIDSALLKVSGGLYTKNQADLFYALIKPDLNDTSAHINRLLPL